MATSNEQRSTAFARGYAAYLAGKQLSDNPEDGDLFYSWDDGWYEAREEWMLQREKNARKERQKHVQDKLS